MGVSPKDQQPLSFEAWSMISEAQAELSEAEWKRLHMQEWKTKD